MSEVEVVTPELLRSWALPGAESSKDRRGQVVVIGGAAGTPGGVALAGLASLRVGAGKVQLAVASSVAPALAAQFPEAGVRGLPETSSGSIAGAEAAERCTELCARADTVLIGPGLDDGEEAQRLLEGLLPSLPEHCALVLDAFALGVLNEVAGHLDKHEAAVVLTPNHRELEMLLDRSTDADPEEVLEAARRFDAAVTVDATIADGGGAVWRVPAGHSGLATAGSGDVLAGLVAGLLARGATRDQAACWGTYLHSTAGERLASAVGGLGFLARELVDQVPAILAELT